MVRGGALLLFPTGIAPSKASVIPVGFPPSHPMDEVRGFFYSFCRGSRALPMLSFFHICRPCGERESFQTRNLGSYNKRFVTAQLVSCLVCRYVSRAQLMGSALLGLTAMGPSGLQGRALLLFLGMGVSPCRFYSFPIPIPSHGRSPWG